MDKEARLKAFEAMLASVRLNYSATVQKMTRLKEAGKEKTATYRQLMGNKLELQNILTMYRVYGLLDEETDAGYEILTKSNPDDLENP